MKQMIVKKLTIAALALCTVPATLIAQQEKPEKPEKQERTEKQEQKEKKDFQQIIITRSGDKEDKTVVEINGDKVKVNGKDVADLKDIQVHINTMRNGNGMSLRGAGRNNFDMTFDNDRMNIFSEDANRAMLGVTTDAHNKGAEIQTVSKGSAAEKAGLKKGDVITKIDGKTIDATDDVSEVVKAHKPGDKVAVAFLRDGKEQKVTAELGKWKGMNNMTFTMPQGMNNQAWKQNIDTQMRGMNDQLRSLNSIPRVPRVQGFTMSDNRPRLGLSVQDTDDGKGVKVLDVDDEGNAGKAGIKEDDIITQLDDKGVNSADEVARLMKEKKDQPNVKFQIIRGGKSQTIDVKVPRKIKTVDL